MPDSGTPSVRPAVSATVPADRRTGGAQSRKPGQNHDYRHDGDPPAIHEITGHDGAAGRVSRAAPESLQRHRTQQSGRQCMRGRKRACLSLAQRQTAACTQRKGIAETVMDNFRAVTHDGYRLTLMRLRPLPDGERPQSSPLAGWLSRSGDHCTHPPSRSRCCQSTADRKTRP